MSIWFANHRQAWIAETIRIFGYIQRQHLIRKFGISMPQASMDISRYQIEHPHDLRYDASRKCYVYTKYK